ncbi:MAG: helix-turn-helix domain-containing protein [Cereibacter sp.]
MAGLSPVTATQEQTTALKVLARGPDRAEADRARALLLTLKGWTSARIAQAFGVREDRVRLWRSDFSRGGACALRARIAPITLRRHSSPGFQNPIAFKQMAREGS